MDAGRITSVASVPDDSTFLFRVADDDGDEREAILVADESGESNGDGDAVNAETVADDAPGVSCWLNYCQHFTHIKLDKGDGAPIRNGELVCANHGAYFEPDSGRCTFGPCEGAYLADLEVAVAEGDVYLTDDEYEFVGPGPLESDDFDRSSTSNVEF